MSISTPFIRRPIATSLLTAALVLIGLAAYPFLPVAPLPRVEFPTITVTVSYPGDAGKIWSILDKSELLKRLLSSNNKSLLARTITNISLLI